MTKEELNQKAKINFIKLKEVESQRFIQLLKDQFKNETVVDRKYKILHEDKFVYFPLIKNKDILDKLAKILNNLIYFDVVIRRGVINTTYKHRSLNEALKGKIPNNYQYLIPKSYDIVGNLAIIEFNMPQTLEKSKLNEYKGLVARAVMNINRNIRTVFEKKSEIKGAYRLRDLAFLLGENKSETIHKENNCIFKLDIKNTYFSPRLVFERRRVATSGIKENEIIVDMFAGVGPFSIQIAKRMAVKIHAFDINSYAFQFFKENIELNRLKGEIIPYNMDIRDLLIPSDPIGKKLCNTSDRIIMNLPEQSMDYIDVACFLMRNSGGTLHFYKFSEKPNPIERTIKDLEKGLDKFNWKINEIINSKIVKAYSPKAELIVIDLNIEAIKN